MGLLALDFSESEAFSWVTGTVVFRERLAKPLWAPGHTLEDLSTSILSVKTLRWVSSGACCHLDEECSHIVI